MCVPGMASWHRGSLVSSGGRFCIQLTVSKGAGGLGCGLVPVFLLILAQADLRDMDCRLVVVVVSVLLVWFKADMILRNLKKSVTIYHKLMVFS